MVISDINISPNPMMSRTRISLSLAQATLYKKSQVSGNARRITKISIPSLKYPRLATQRIQSKSSGKTNQTRNSVNLYSHLDSKYK